MLRTKKFVKEICNSDLPVIICGETGTGKELLPTRFIVKVIEKINHLLFKIAQLFLKVYLKAYFWLSKRGFTDSPALLGLFELANGGTLFLDEINSVLYITGKIIKE